MDMLDRLLRRLLCKVNKVTSPFRHSQIIPKRDLINLSNYQIDVEKALSERDTSMLNDAAHEIWAAAQLLPEEGIEDGVGRVQQLVKEKFKPKANGLTEGHSCSVIKPLPATRVPKYPPNGPKGAIPYSANSDFPSFEEADRNIANKYPASFSDEGRLTGKAYFSAKAMYNLLKERFNANET